MTDSLALLEESIALLKRSRGDGSRAKAHQLVRGSLKAVVREAGQVGDHHVRILADDLASSWTGYEESRNGDVRGALSKLVAVKTSLDSLRVAMSAGGVSTFTLAIQDSLGAELLRQEIPADRIPEKYRGKGAVEQILHHGTALTSIKPNRSKTWTLRLPELSPWQRKVHRDDTRMQVLACGRQSGKTAVCLSMALRDCLLGREGWWISPTFAVAESAWKDALRFVRAISDRLPGVKVDQRPLYRVSFPSAGSIQFRSSDNPDSLRGETLDFAVCDEYAFGADIWSVLRPMLGAREGRATFISTPAGRNFFFDMFEAAQQPGWARWHITTQEGGLVPLEEVEAARENLPAGEFDQEYGAAFVSPALAVFHREHVQHFGVRHDSEGDVYLLGTHEVPAGSCKKIITADLAVSTRQQADFTVIAAWAITPKDHLLLLDSIRDRMQADAILRALRAMQVKHGGTVYVERASQSIALIDLAISEGLPVRGVKAERDKLSRAQTAAAKMSRGEVWFPHDRDAPWLKELLDELFAFPNGRHDDFVDAMALRGDASASETVCVALDEGGKDTIPDSPYGVALHEAAHSVIATMFGAPWHAVSARERHGSLLPDKEAWRGLLESDPDGSWPKELFAMISLAGPLAEARWNLALGELDRQTQGWFNSLERGYGGEVDIPTAHMWAREAGTSYETLADDLIRLMNTDKIWLVIQRVADALVEKGTLITTDVNQLVYGNVRGAGA